MVADQIKSMDGLPDSWFDNYGNEYLFSEMMNGAHCLTKSSLGNLRSPLLIKISIFDLDTGEQIRDHHTRDIRKGKNKEWLTNAMMWAVMNNKRIEVRKKK